MDEEDMADAEDAKKLQTAGGFGGLGGGTAEDATRKNILLDIVRPGANDSIGVKLLQKMGWRQGQGVGPRIRRKARVDDGDEHDQGDGQEHFFAPDNSKMIEFLKKNDSKGLGYAGEAPLGRAIEEGKPEQEEDDGDAAWNRAKPKKLKPKVKKPSFGVGVLNDTGSDDEDPYSMGPKISYNRTISGDKKPKKKPIVGGANPLLASRPVFMPKKTFPGKSSSSGGFRKCHDGRLPLDGFLLAMQALDITPANKYAPPNIPDAWKGKHSRWDVAPSTQYQSTAEAAKGSTLDPKARASVLGEEALPGKSIFDFLSPAARNKLATASGRTDLPPAGGEDAPVGYRLTKSDAQKQLWNLVPELSKVVALEALQRGVSGWMPYADDDAKRARYTVFLELKAGLRNSLPERAPGLTKDDWKNEMSEFAQAAEVFRPITGAMATRFTSSSRTYEGTSNDPSAGNPSLLNTPSANKPEDPAEAAAKIGMYGPMTRSIHSFHPTRLLCKRFNVRPPANVDVDPGAEFSDPSASKVVTEMLPKKAIERMMQDAAVRRFVSREIEDGSGGEEQISQQGFEGEGLREEVVVDVERNEALEAERPGDAVFRAIFGSDSEDDD
jgi:G patch domain-containing protein 1